MDYDTAWCPACDRQILPKRFLVNLDPTTPQAPPPPPSSPQSPTPARRTKTGTIRQRGGLVNGTGRVKPNGSIRRPEQKQQQQPQQPPPPVKQRMVIDQSPIPLYCSDECKMADINANRAGLPHNYNPDRQSKSPSPVPFDRRPSDDDSAASSIESQSSISSSDSRPTTHQSPSLATLAAMYNFGPPPPPAPVDENTATPSRYPQEYTTGVMMAARRIFEMCPKPQKRDAYGHIIPPAEPRKPIPGWTDGSNAWRSSTYSFSAPRQEESKAHRALASSSRAIHSAYASSPSRPATSRASSLPADTDEMLTKFSQSFNRRSESRASLYSPSPSPSLASFPSTAPTRRERSLLQPGAEGKLLVPDVKMKVHSTSPASLSSGWSTSSRRSSSVRSPLSMSSCTSVSGDEDDRTQRCDSSASVPQTVRRPTVETRSWSYDNIKTYPIMTLPPKKEKRIERRVVDGVETEVEVEVVVEVPLKRLFLFSAPIRA